MSEMNLLVSSDLVGERLDVAAAVLLYISRTAAADLIDQDLLTVNSKHAARSYKVQLNDQLEVLPKVASAAEP